MMKTTLLVAVLLMLIAHVFLADWVVQKKNDQIIRYRDTLSRVRTITEAQLSGDTLKIKTQHDANNH